MRVKFYSILLTMILTIPILGSYSRYPDMQQLQDILGLIRKRSSFDTHMSYFNVSANLNGKEIVLTGKVGDGEQKLLLFAGFKQLFLPIVDRVEVFPFKEIANPYGMVRSSLLNAYEMPEEGPVVTQFLHGSLLRILEKQNGWLQVQNISDRYIAWVPETGVFLMTNETYDKLVQWDSLVVNKKQTHILKQLPIEQKSENVQTLLLGSRLPVIAVEQSFYKVLYPGNDQHLQTGYISQYDSRLYVPSDIISPHELLNTAQSFLGVPYSHGKNSILGWDSSGFVQTVFKLHGHGLPREWNQQKRLFSPIYNRSYLKPGDLVFFTEQVGLYLGSDRFIYVSPQQQKTVISSFNAQHPDYDPWFDTHFLSGGRFKNG